MHTIFLLKQTDRVTVVVISITASKNNNTVKALLNPLYTVGVIG